MRKTTISLLTTLLFSSSLVAQTAPGGVSTDLNYWLKADAGVTTRGGLVSQWNNQTAIGGNINQNNNALRPSVTANALNFNPAVSFNIGTNPRTVDFLSTDDLVWDSDTVILVFNPSQSSGNRGTLQTVLVYNIPNNARGDAGIGIGTINGNGNFFNSTDITPAEPGEYIAESRVSPNTTDDPILAVVRQNTITNPTQSQHRFWGQDTNINISNLDQYASHQKTEFTIGQRDGGGLPFDGDVLEAISYASRLGDAPLRRIESYLSIKYGLTLNQNTPQDYLSSSENTIYDADGDLSDFVSNIAGIGRDDDSGLNQKQSISSTTNSVQTNSRGLVTIGLGTIAATNASNRNNFAADQTFMLWGNDAASTDFIEEFTNSSIDFTRMQRLWAIQETGNVGTVQLTIPQSVFDRNLTPSLVISNNTFIGSADNVINLSDDGNNNYTAIVNFNDGDFFTFAQSESVVVDSPSDNLVHITKRNATGFAIDGNNGAENRQSIFLYQEDENNQNQQWIEIDRGNGFFSYQKNGTNHCIDGNRGGANGQDVYLWVCGDNNQNQHWRKVSVGGGAVRLVKRNAPGFAINGGNRGANRQNVNLFNSSNRSQNLHWIITPL